MIKTSDNHNKKQAGIAIGSAIGFVIGLLTTGFPLGVVWIAVGALFGEGFVHLLIKRRL